MPRAAPRILFSGSQAVSAILLLGWLAGLGTAARPLMAQPGAEAPATPSQGSPPQTAGRNVPPPERSPLDLVYLRNSEGELVPVLRGLSWEEFERIRDAAVEGPERPAVGYSPASLKLNGSVSGNRANLALELEVKMLARPGEWVKVPLDLRPATLVALPTIERGFVTLERESGYTLWLQAGEEQANVRVSLTLAAPVERQGKLATLRVNCPNAAFSEAKLLLDLARAEVRQEGNRDLRVLPQGKQTRVELLGLGGVFEVIWQAAPEAVAPLPAVLEAAGEILYAFESDSLTSDARLRVRSRRGDFDRFVITLPPGFRYLPAARPAVEYAVAPLAENGLSTDEPEQVEIRLPAPTKGPVEVRLLASATRDPSTEAGAPWKLGGWEVSGAARQWGYLACAVEGTRVLKFQLEEPVRRATELPETLQRGNVVAGFEYSRLPGGIGVSVVERESRLAVQPIFILRVESGRVSLDARCRYTNQGAKPYFLEGDFAGWVLHEVGPSELVKENVDLSEPENLLVPLRMPPDGDFELRVQAHLEFAAEAGTLTVPLPQLAASDRRAPMVVLLEGTDLEAVLPPGDPMPLAPATLPDDLRGTLSNGAQVYQYLRSEDRGGLELQVRRRSDQVEIESRLFIDQRSVRVRQNFDFEFTRDPRAIHWRLEDSRVGNLRVSADGVELASRWVVSDRDGVRELVVDPPSSGPSRRRVQVDYEIAEIFPPGNYRVSLAVPLAMPTMETAPVVLANRVTVQTADLLRATLEGGQWRSEMEADSQPLSLFAVDRVSQLPLRLEHPQVDSRRLTIVQQCWLQTYLSPEERQDRVVLRVAAGEPQLTLRLPEGTDVDSVDVLVDGRAAAASWLPESRLRLELPEEQVKSSLLVEVWCRSSPPADGWRRLVRPIETLDVAATRQAFWHVALPRDVLLLGCVPAAAREDRWVWRWPDWGFQPKLSQGEVAAWIAPESNFHLPEGMNLHLFSSVETPRELQLVTSTRRWVWLAASLAVFFPGLLLASFRGLRHPLLLLGSGLVLAATAWFYPEPALIFGPFALLGGVALGVARVVQWSLDRRREGVVRGASRAAAGTVGRMRPAAEGNRDTTATAVGGLPLSSVSSQSS